MRSSSLSVEGLILGSGIALTSSSFSESDSLYVYFFSWVLKSQVILLREKRENLVIAKGFFDLESEGMEGVSNTLKGIGSSF